MALLNLTDILLFITYNIFNLDNRNNTVSKNEKLI